MNAGAELSFLTFFSMPTNRSMPSHTSPDSAHRPRLAEVTPRREHIARRGRSMGSGRLICCRGSKAGFLPPLPQITACLPEPPSSRDRSSYERSTERAHDCARSWCLALVSVFGELPAIVVETVLPNSRRAVEAKATLLGGDSELRCRDLVSKTT